MTLYRLCARCGVKLDPREHGSRGPCPDCKRTAEREKSRQRRATSPSVKTRNSRLWQRARETAKQRDGYRCTGCGSSSKLQVHHVVPIEQGGEPFLISNLVTLCRTCHEKAEREAKSVFLREGAHTRPLAFREKNSKSPKHAEEGQNLA